MSSILCLMISDISVLCYLHLCTGLHPFPERASVWVCVGRGHARMRLCVCACVWHSVTSNLPCLAWCLHCHRMLSMILWFLLVLSNEWCHAFFIFCSRLFFIPNQSRLLEHLLISHLKFYWKKNTMARYLCYHFPTKSPVLHQPRRNRIRYLQYFDTLILYVYYNFIVFQSHVSPYRCTCHPTRIAYQWYIAFLYWEMCFGEFGTFKSVHWNSINVHQRWRGCVLYALA